MYHVRRKFIEITKLTKSTDGVTGAEAAAILFNFVET